MAGKDKKQQPAKCTARKADGRPCQAAALRGTTRCYHHSFSVPGRPSKLTEDVKDRIVDAVLEGNYLETSAQVAGVSKATLYRWLRRADELEAMALEHVTEEDLDQGIDPYQHLDPALWVYLDFRHALKSAEAYAETELLRQARSGRSGWQAPMTVLERRHAHRWGRRLDAHVEHSGEVKRQVEVIVPPDDERAAVLERLRQAGAFDEVEPADTENTN